MRVVSGIKPTGNLHLGNYLGAIKQWVGMQADVEAAGGESMYFIADLHALTEWSEPAAITDSTFEVSAAMIASGIDPSRSILFNQARVPAHSELAWLLNNVARVGWLNRMTQFKDKAGKDREAASVGLYTYPNLMAADILLYRATHVPVGEDQKQHLELARDIAAKFNSDFGLELFTLPDPIIPKESARIMSLRDGSAKMSKSDPSDMSRINLTDNDDAIMNKVKKAKTDPEPLPETAAGLVGRPEANNLIGIYATLSGTTTDAVCADFAGKGFGAFKPALGEVLVEALRPIRERFLQLRTDDDALDAILDKGAAKAAAAAEPTLRAAYDAMGLMR